MNLEQKFLTYYQRLNPAQKEAVDAIEGPVMVIAGPGTGKTQILTLRIANILRQTDTAPSNILALTFTESGVISIRRRLAEIIGSRAYAVVINTFHGFGNDIIKSYPEDFPRIIGSRQITEVDQVAILEDLIKTKSFKILKPFGDPFLYVRPALAAINDLKREGLQPKDFSILVKTERRRLKKLPGLYHKRGRYQGNMKAGYQKLFREIDKNEELAVLYDAYQKKLAADRLYDYSDMIMEVLLILRKNKVLRQILQEEYQYFLVDEHQDTNNAQNRIIEILASFHEAPNLFVVGDEKQAIFRFQGASLENFIYFKRRWPAARLITLEENYRSSAIILQSAENILASEKPLQAKAGWRPAPIKVAALATPDQELFFVGWQIKKDLAQGVLPEQIAVLYRDNKDAFPIAASLEKMNVPFTIESDEDLLAQTDVRKLWLILQAVENFGDHAILAELLHLDWFKLSPLTVYRLISQAAKEKKPLLELVSRHRETKKFYRQLAAWRIDSKNFDLLIFFERLVRDSGVLESIITSPATEDRLAAIRRLADEIAGLLEAHPDATLADFLKYLEIIKTHRLFIKRTKIVGRPGQVRLMTAHRSKGLEFDRVYIIGAYDGYFGGRRNRDLIKLLPRVYLLSPTDKKTKTVNWSAIELAQADDDDRRLFYVALTRAKKQVTISYSRLSAGGREQLPAVFITEIKPKLKEEINSAAIEKRLAKNRDFLFRSPSDRRQTLADKNFIKEIFLDQGFSVSALNNYLICPWRYFYRNLIRLPEALTLPQIYGLVVHAALRDFFRPTMAKDLNSQRLILSFEKYLATAALSKKDYQEMLTKGRRALNGWYRAYHKTWPRNVLVEFKINGVLLTPNIRLIGVLDKLEFKAGDNQVTVVDYKTRQPLSRRQIMGETTTEDGSYFRQLLFYKLLLDLYENGKYQMTEGVIDFIEPNPRGGYKKEVFKINDGVKELKALVLKTAEEILTLKFWNKRCDDKSCYYCRLRDLMKPIA